MALTLFLRIWKPKTVFRFDDGTGTALDPTAGGSDGGTGLQQPSRNNRRRTPVPAHAGTMRMRPRDPKEKWIPAKEEHPEPVRLGENEFPMELAEERPRITTPRDTEFASEVSALPSRPPADHGGPRLTAASILRAWSPFLVLTLMISLWGVPAVKQALAGNYAGPNGLLQLISGAGHALSFHPHVPGLHNVVIGENGRPMAAEFKLELLGAAGTAIFLATIITMFIYRVSFIQWLRTLWETVQEMKFSILTVMSVIGFAYIANYSGLSSTLGRSLSLTGFLFPLFSPIIGWLGVFITGSDTSANLLFGNLQKVTADRVGMEPVLALAANTTGGGTAKMISPQSIAIASAAVGLNGRESELLRFTFKHSVILLIAICVLTYLQSNILAWMVP